MIISDENVTWLFISNCHVVGNLKNLVYQIPRLYETDGIPLEEKIIYQKWEIPQTGFYWLISELDRKENPVFGYANLNDHNFAECGYISIEELIDNGQTLTESGGLVRFIRPRELSGNPRAGSVNYE